MSPLVASSQPDLLLLARLERLRDSSLAAGGAFALLILAAWLFAPLGARLPDGWWLMKANTALGLALLTAAYFLARPGRALARQTAGWACAAGVVVLAGWVLLEYAGHAPFSIDTLLADDPYTQHSGRMSLQTALVFLTIGITLPFLPLRKSAAAWLIDGLVALALLMWLVYLAGYFFGAALLFGESVETRISLQTLISLAPLIFAAAVGRLETGVFSVLVGIGIGSHIARLTLPFAVVLPYVLDFAGGVALLRDWLTLPYVAALSSALIAHAFFFLVMAMAWRINGLEQELRAQSLTDALTGLANRRGFDILGEQVWLEARRLEKPVTVMFFDLDGLKAVNDTQGHDAGSQLLADAAHLLRATFRASDVVARVGGDEFAVVTHGEPASLDAALARLDAARRNTNLQNPRYAIRYSVGVASAVPQQDSGFSALVSRADEAMYTEKHHRKANRIKD